MKKFIALIVLIALAGGGYYYSQNKGSTDVPEKIERGTTEIKEVEVFDLSKDRPEIKLKKPGNSQAYNIATISAQVAGRITAIPVKVGQKVNKGQELAKLGDSLSTDMMDLNYETAKGAKNLSEQSQSATEVSANATLQAAENGIKMSIDGYKNALKARDNNKQTFYLQYQNSKSDIANAQDNYDDIENDLDDANEELDDAENAYDDFLDSNPDPSTSAETIAQLKGAIKAAEAKIDALESARDGLENALEKTEQGLDLLKSSSRSQLDQLEYAVQSSFNQYNNAINQYNSAQAAATLQEINAANGALQSGSNLKGAKLSQDQKSVKSPINGVVSAIIAEENNLTAPGQVIMKIEDDSKIKITSSLSTEEAKLIKTGDQVEIANNDEVFQGVILSISPSSDPITKKINVEIAITEKHNIQAGTLIEVIYQAKTQNKIYLPLSSITINGNTKLVRIVDKNGTMQELEVQTGNIVEAYIEIISGLKGDEKVLKLANNFLEIGEKVKESTKIER